MTALYLLVMVVPFAILALYCAAGSVYYAREWTDGLQDRYQFHSRLLFPLLLPPAFAYMLVRRPYDMLLFAFGLILR